MTKPALALLLGLALACTPLGGCASSPKSAPLPDPDPGSQTQQTSADADPNLDPVAHDDPDDPDELPPVSAPPGLTAMDRVQSAVDGMLLGAIIGAQAGPIGIAVGAGTLLIYSAITGHVPLKGASGPSRGGSGGGGGGGGGGPDEQQREEDLEREIEREEARGEVLETQIEEELQRQEELLKQIEAGAATPEKPGGSDENLAERADPRTAPEAPKDRDLPMAIFEKQTVEIEAGTWEGQTRDIEVVKRTLDADRDGKPEEIRYFDEKSSTVMIRKEQDTDYDGVIDTWSTYTKGQLTRRLVDANADGKPDTWETYEGGRMVAREIDRDQDGTKDAIYTFAAGALVEEKHDANNDGEFDLIVTYENKVRARSIEDRNKDGKPDTWTTFQSNGSQELVVRVEKDTNDSGKADVFETYDTLSGKSVLAKRQEDRNEDGTPDVTSIYENGKLVRREISDPALVPL